MFLEISVCFGIGTTIRIGREIQCLPYAGVLGPIVETVEIIMSGNTNKINLNNHGTKAEI